MGERCEEEWGMGYSCCCCLPGLSSPEVESTIHQIGSGGRWGFRGRGRDGGGEGREVCKEGEGGEEGRNFKRGPEIYRGKVSR